MGGCKNKLDSRHQGPPFFDRIQGQIVRSHNKNKVETREIFDNGFRGIIIKSSQTAFLHNNILLNG